MVQNKIKNSNKIKKEKLQKKYSIPEKRHESGSVPINLKR